jgi:hypothetical protein
MRYGKSLIIPALRAIPEKGRQAEGSSSFLKKRTKKLLP